MNKIIQCTCPPISGPKALPNAWMGFSCTCGAMVAEKAAKVPYAVEKIAPKEKDTVSPQPVYNNIYKPLCLDHDPKQTFYIQKIAGMLAAKPSEIFACAVCLLTICYNCAGKPRHIAWTGCNKSIDWQSRGGTNIYFNCGKQVDKVTYAAFPWSS